MYKSTCPHLSLSSHSFSMGCTSSKLEREEKHRSTAALFRSSSVHVHHPAQWEGDACHIVSLTSSTLGSLNLDPIDDDPTFRISKIRHDEAHEEDDHQDKKIDQPEIINIREMMAGLESPRSLYRYPLEKSFSLNDQAKKTKFSLFEKSQSFDHGGSVRSRIMAFQEKINAARAKPKGKIVFYFTTLRGVKKTFEDCCSVREILRGYDVMVDERDVSLHRGFREELVSLLGSRHESFKLPRVFFNGRLLGDAEEIQRLHDEGELGDALKGCEKGRREKEGFCEGCGGVRFVPCGSCSGSCKIFVEGEESGQFRRCPDCNENGLVLCPICRIRV